MKKTKIIIPAMGMLLLGTAASVTGTVAWFSANSAVSVTGMAVRTKVDSNLMVAASTAGTTKSQDSAFGTYADQIVNATLQPASTVDGVNFFYTYNAKADGTKQSGNYTAVASNTIGDAKAYADYVIELKAVNTGSEQATIKLNKLNLLYNNAVVSGEKAYRVAIFIQAQSESIYAEMGNAADMIYTMNDAHYHQEGKAVDSVSTVGTIAHLNTAISSMTVPAGESKYYKVTARLWLEGEDTTCNNTTFKTLTSDWKLNLGFSLLNDAEAVTRIGSVAETSYTLTQTLTNVTSNVSETTILANTAFSAIYKAAQGKTLPSTITVVANGVTLVVGTDYTWDNVNGLLVINSQLITGNVTITISAAE